MADIEEWIKPGDDLEEVEVDADVFYGARHARLRPRVLYLLEAKRRLRDGVF
jgi:hypothetical protein